MQRTLTATCILLALALPRLIHGRPDNGSSVLSMLTARASKLEDLSDYERQKATSSFAQGSSPIPTKLRVKRVSSDHRLSELEALMTVWKINNRQSWLKSGRLDPARIGRRRRFTNDQIFSEVRPVVTSTERQKLRTLIS